MHRNLNNTSRLS